MEKENYKTITSARGGNDIRKERLNLFLSQGKLTEEMTLELGQNKQTRWRQERGHLSHAKTWSYKPTGTFCNGQVADRTVNLRRKAMRDSVVESDNGPVMESSTSSQEI